jgi:hypothetical protein
MMDFFEMYFDDHHPPHVHVIIGKNERVSVLIDTLAIQAGEPVRKLRPVKLGVP